jgi:hypothetical protein
MGTVNNPYQPTLKTKIAHGLINTTVGVAAITTFLIPFAIFGGCVYIIIHFAHKLW